MRLGGALIHIRAKSIPKETITAVSHKWEARQSCPWNPHKTPPREHIRDFDDTPNQLLHCGNA
jgi:hypothetical protein